MRKNLEQSSKKEKLSIDKLMEQKMLTTLAFIEKCERLEHVLSGNLMEDIRVKKIAPYNASIALSNLVTSKEKLLNLSLNLLERLQKFRPEPQDSRSEIDDHDLRFRRQVEMLCMEMAEKLYPPEEANL